MIDLLKPYKLKAAEFNLLPEYFDHCSMLHGINHTYRVMIHVLNIGIIEKLIHEARIAFFAAYIHDMARQNDGICKQHGADSARTKLPLFISFFKQFDIGEQEIQSIANAVTFHSKSLEINTTNNDFTITAILKDADALDRVRLGYGEPNEKYLRFPNSKRYIYFAHQLLESTPVNGFVSFNDAAKTAEALLNSNTYL